MEDLLLLGPGPANCSPAVRAALAGPTVGHLDPLFLERMDAVQASLRQVFGTTNEITFPVSGTGSAGMETLLTNLVERDDRVVVAVNGVFGGRAAELSRRLGARVETVDHEWGQPVSPTAVADALAAGPPAKLLFFVHAETSTGALSDAAALARSAHDHGALAVMDCVTSLAGLPVELDAWGVDAAFAGTQKCLSAPTGLAPVSLSDRALHAIRSRTTPVTSWYFDLSMVERYWGPERTYHHTAPVNLIAALEAALDEILEEGLEARFQRHRQAHETLLSGLRVLGLDLLPPLGARLPMLNAVTLPAGLDDAAVRSGLRQRHHIEIGAGLGVLKGRVVRIGLMGHNARPENVFRLLHAFAVELNAAGHACDGNASVQAAARAADSPNAT